MKDFLKRILHRLFQASKCEDCGHSLGDNFEHCHNCDEWRAYIQGYSF